MLFALGEIVMVVHTIDRRAADDLPDTVDHPLASRVGVLAAQLHAGEIGAAQVAAGVKDSEGDVDAVLTAGKPQVFCSRRMAKARGSRSGRRARRDSAHQVNVVVAAIWVMPVGGVIAYRDQVRPPPGAGGA